MIEKRGYESALSACPAPAAAFAAAAPAPVRRRVAAPAAASFLGAATPFQGTGLPVAGQFVAAQRVIDGPDDARPAPPG